MREPALLEVASSYARRGWSVLPLHHPLHAKACSCCTAPCHSIGKHPVLPGGVLSASRDPGLVAEWFPEGTRRNIGIATGSGSNLVVLDVDPAHGGDASLEALVAAHGALPETVEVLTGGGGRHLYFAHPGGHVPNSAGKLGPGLDVRGDKGYVVAPPSLHTSGKRYGWECSSEPGEVPVAALPDWLLALVRPAPVARTPAKALPNPKWLRLLQGGVQEGQRNIALASLSGHLFRAYRGHPRVAAELALLWNAQRCEPPLSEEEAVRVIASIWEREAARRAKRGARG